MKVNNITKGYILFFAILMLVYHSINPPKPVGEWDDYSLPIASILNDYNFSISDDDVAVYKDLFSDWADAVDGYSLSGYITKSGNGQMTWYFPIYSIACIPFVLMLRFLKLPAIFAFPYTNIAVLMIALVFVYKYLKCGNKKKLLLILLLSVNPIVLYIRWTSAEVFIYSMLVIGLTSYYNLWRKRAAIFVSIAGMLNPTIMSIGIVMIIEYGVQILIHKNLERDWITYIKNEFPEILKYGCCYIIGIVPMLYNYYNVGCINLTASLSAFTHGTESTFSRFIAYLFDLNMGILPYFTIIFIVSVVLLVVAFVKRHIAYIVWFLTFLLNIALYSIMIHINCGMSGISRYNSWGVVILILAVALFYDEVINKSLLKKIFTVSLYCGIALTGAIVKNSNSNYVNWTPVAEWFLNYMPSVYNPLYSTFNSRTTHQDGGYGYLYELPIVYTAEDGYVRKMLITQENKDEIISQYISQAGYDNWLSEQIDSIGNTIGYISVPKKYKIIRACQYSLGTPIIFTIEKNNALDYISDGFSIAEDWGTWTDENIAILRFVSDSNHDIISGTIHCQVYNNSQDVSIYVNDNLTFYSNDFTGGIIRFDFENPGKQKLVEVRIELPDACSPFSQGQSEDRRTLGLGIQMIKFSELGLE